MLQYVNFGPSDDQANAEWAALQGPPETRKVYTADDVKLVVELSEGVTRKGKRFEMRNTPGGLEVRARVGHTLPSQMRIHSQTETMSNASDGPTDAPSNASAASGRPMRRMGSMRFLFGSREYCAHSLTAATLLRRRKRGDPLTRRERLFLFLEEPGASVASARFGVLIWASLLLFAACVTFESLQEWHDAPAAAW